MSTASKSSSSGCGRYLLSTVIAALGVVAIVGSGGGGGEIESMWVVLCGGHRQQWDCDVNRLAPSVTATRRRIRGLRFSIVELDGSGDRRSGAKRALTDRVARVERR